MSSIYILLRLLSSLTTNSSLIDVSTGLHVRRIDKSGIGTHGEFNLGTSPGTF